MGYANHHRHSGLALFTPADVFFGRVEGIVEVRQAALDGGYALHPERFVKGPPRVRRPPAVVAINPLDPTAPKSLEKLLRAGDTEFMAPNPTPATDPQPVLPGAPNATANPT